MAFCTNCGAQIPDGKQFCPNCGAPLANRDQSFSQPSQMQQTRPVRMDPYGDPNNNADNGYNNYNNSYMPPQEADSGSFGWAVLGFCIPVAGLILYLVWKDTKPRPAAAAGKGALVSFILGVLFYIIGIVVSVFAGAIL